MFFGKHLERQNELLTSELVRALRESQALNLKLSDGLDRVLASRFDAPLMPSPMEQPKRETPLDMGDLLSVEDDEDFFERLDAAEARAIA